MEKRILEVIKKDFEYEYWSVKHDNHKFPDLDLKSTASTYLMALSIVRFWEENHEEFDLEEHIKELEANIDKIKEELEEKK